MTVDLALRASRAGSDYAALKRLVKTAGLLDRSFVASLPRIVTVACMLAAGAASMILLQNSWWQLVVATYLAAVVAQIGFLAHDAGHQQIFRSRGWNDRFGRLVSNGVGGLSYGWWVDKHNRHHRHPNDVDRDPDVQRNLLSWTTDQANDQRGLARMIARNQAWFFFPLLLFEAANLQVSSVRRLADRREHRVTEAVLLAVHAVGGIALLLFVMSPLKAIAFIAVQQGLLGLYLGMSFAPNHKGMQLASSVPAADFLRRQVLTSRNVRGGRILAVAFGGLNYQIEHHLFPSMPSRNLWRARRIVRRFCVDRGIPYREATAFDSYCQVLRYLHRVKPVVGIA